MTDHTDYTKEELSGAFDLVKNQEDWKEPINKVVRVKNRKHADLISTAIMYFTTTEPEVDKLKGRNLWRFRALGYRQGPAGP